MVAAPSAIIRDILRVDHAGEYGAIRIYGAQIAVARRLAPNLLQMLEHALGDERRHSDIFCPRHGRARNHACNMLPLWGVGGTLLGLFTSLLGHDAILVCTEAVERTVHRHMNDQIIWLSIPDPALAAVIAEIRDEEVGHLDDARAAGRAKSGMFLWCVDRMVSGTTELLVWLSTYGASVRLSGWMAAAGDKRG